MDKKKIAVASDHAGVDLKNEINMMLQKMGYAIIDCGVYDKNSVDYPDIAEKLTCEVLENSCLGVIVCGTGIGVSIAANKVPGIRAALCHNEFTARLAREHNNANVIALGARVIGSELALECVKTFVNTDFSGGRHQKRVDKILNLEGKYKERG